MDKNKLEAVREYLNGKFPGAEIKEKYDSDLFAQTFKIYNDSDLLLLKVSKDFLGDNSEGQIKAALDNLKIAELLVENNELGVLVSNDPPSIFEPG